MGEVKRWMVTFTKHLKQKRKVYQDGFLDIHSSSNKALLYDECEKLLECRILKQDEVISCGETLTFNAYLVDIEAPQGDQKPKAGLDSQGSDDKVSGKYDLLRGKNFRNVFSASAEKNRTQPQTTVSPSHKIIREFKKSRFKCYGSPQSSPDTRKIVETEWQVLYTMNITQKAKKYHDGFLKLSTSGSLGGQVMLFDEHRKLLASRFIEKDDLVKSGESIAFDAHLVDIGEHERDDKHKIDLCQGADSSDGVKRVLHGQKKPNKENGRSIGKEWHVLYTSQLTQKSKKYHNGIIKISSSGSHHMQVTLLNEDKSILSSKYVSLLEDFTTGHVLELPKYLVEVGEACDSVQGRSSKNDHNSRKDKTICISGGDEKKSHRETTEKSVRDAREILYILQRPKALVSLSAGRTEGSNKISALTHEVHELSNADVSDLPQDDPSHQEPREKLDMRESTENAETSQFLVLNQSTFTGSGEPLMKEVKIENASQLIQSDGVDAKSESSLRSFSSRMQNSSDDAAGGPVKDEGKSCEERSCERMLYDCPSFDLGI